MTAPRDSAALVAEVIRLLVIMHGDQPSRDYDGCELLRFDTEAACDAYAKAPSLLGQLADTIDTLRRELDAARAEIKDWRDAVTDEARDCGCTDRMRARFAAYGSAPSAAGEVG